MKIETLANLVKGELLNTPFISEVTSFTMDVDEVTRGSCFFVTNSEDIKYAPFLIAYFISSLFVTKKQLPLVTASTSIVKEVTSLINGEFKSSPFIKLANVSIFT